MTKTNEDQASQGWTVSRDWQGRRDALDLGKSCLRRWISFPSVSDTSNDAVNEDIAGVLGGLGFEITWDRFADRNGIPKSNLIAHHPGSSGSESPGLAYFCHTDVVPVADWSGPGDDPFDAVEQDGRIYGRGSCDMKGSLAAMVAAASSVARESLSAPLWIVCTADEEVGFQGARHLVNHSPQYRDLVAHQPVSIIGEPTEMEVVHAHKGIAGYRMISRGRAAHSSTDEGINANVAMVPLMHEMESIRKRTLNESSLQNPFFSPPHLSWNYGISDSMAVVNITPEKSTAWVCFRSMPDVNHQSLVDQLREAAKVAGVEWVASAEGQPVWIDPKAEHIVELSHLLGTPSKTVCYGTDGGEFSELSRRVVLGPGSIRQAHTSREFIELEQLEQGMDVYRTMIQKYVC